MTEPTFTVSEEVVTAYGEWTLCAAFRFVPGEDGLVVFEATNDLDRITDPESSDE